MVVAGWSCPGFSLDCAMETVNMHGVKRILIAVWTAGMMSATPGPVAAREEPVQPCPVLKVVITEFPINEKLMMHPAPESHFDSMGGAVYVFDPSKLRGIRVAVMWANRTGEPLRDVTLRLEYQQMKTHAIRTAERRFADVPVKGQWTIFDLSGGEYEDTVHVAAWRVSVFSGERVLGSKHSAMWSVQ